VRLDLVRLGGVRKKMSGDIAAPAPWLCNPPPASGI
jgi:hypothetical protein